VKIKANKGKNKVKIKSVYGLAKLEPSVKISHLLKELRGND
jgi:hypothetical protein